MGYAELAVLIFKFAFEIWKTIKEHREDVKKQKTELLQSVARGIIDRDASRITAGFDAIDRVR